jgi:type IV fimbrial biogenesis protein FimT
MTDAIPPFRRARCSRTASGVTLVELLVVIAVAAVLTMIAVPSLVASAHRNAADTAANQLVASLSLARSEAIKTGCQINVTSVGAGLDWSAGWSIDSVASSTCAQELVTTANPTPAAPPSVHKVSAFPSPLKVFGATAVVSFDPTGRLTGPGVSFTSEWDFLICADGATNTAPNAQGVTVLASGRTRVADNNAGGVPQTNKLVAMACVAPPA